MARPWSVVSSPTLTTAVSVPRVDDLLQPGEEPGRADPAREHRDHVGAPSIASSR